MRSKRLVTSRFGLIQAGRPLPIKTKQKRICNNPVSMHPQSIQQPLVVAVPPTHQILTATHIMEISICMEIPYNKSTYCYSTFWEGRQAVASITTCCAGGDIASSKTNMTLDRSCKEETIETFR